MAAANQITRHDLDLIDLGNGSTLLDLSEQGTVMLVFLRHLGCVFCRESLEDIREKKSQLHKSGVTLVFVHMEAMNTAAQYLAKYNLEDVLHISDPDCTLYQKFNLVKARLGQLLGFQTLVKGFSKGIELSQFGGKAFGDAFQMPGVFILHNGKIVDTFVHHQVWDRPDYVQLANRWNKEV